MVKNAEEFLDKVIKDCEEKKFTGELNVNFRDGIPTKCHKTRTWRPKITTTQESFKKLEEYIRECVERQFSGEITFDLKGGLVNSCSKNRVFKYRDNLFGENAGSPIKKEGEKNANQKA